MSAPRVAEYPLRPPRTGEIPTARLGVPNVPVVVGAYVPPPPPPDVPLVLPNTTPPTPVKGIPLPAGVQPEVKMGLGGIIAPSTNVSSVVGKVAPVKALPVYHRPTLPVVPVVPFVPPVGKPRTLWTIREKVVEPFVMKTGKITSQARNVPVLKGKSLPTDKCLS